MLGDEMNHDDFEHRPGLAESAGKVAAILVASLMLSILISVVVLLIWKFALLPLWNYNP